MIRAVSHIGVLMGILLGAIGAAAADDRMDALFSGSADYRLALSFDAYLPPPVADPDAEAEAPTPALRGRLTLDMAALGGGFQLVRDLYGAAMPDNRIKDLPNFAFDYVQVGDQMVPLERGIIETAHPYFDYVLTPGRAWHDDGFTTLSLPIALMEKNANCVHNGALMVRLNSAGDASNAILQIGSETCAYFQFNFWASYQAKWTSTDIGDAEAIGAAYDAEQRSLLPVKPVATIAADHPALDIDAIEQADKIRRADMSTFGVVIDGTHYVGGCNTRLGAYPHCASMVLPSYSLAKSLAGGLGLMALEKRYPGASDALVADHVAAFSGEQWNDVTFRHLADMTTGNYKSAKPHVDEAAAHYMPFFDAVTSAEKTAFVCDHFKRKSKPGKRWVYHTSDTYLLGVAMNGFLAAKEGSGADFYRNILVPIWRQLGLSPLSHTIRRTGGEPRQPFTGYGMVLTRGDIAKIAYALASANDAFASNFVPEMLGAAMQRDPDARGKKAGGADLKYKHSFWGWNAKKALGCKRDVWLPFLSGYGGISVVMLPNGGVYYYFSDGGAHLFATPVKELSNTIDICGEAG